MTDHKDKLSMLIGELNDEEVNDVNGFNKGNLIFVI
jgi:hypothetical protein